MKTSVSASKKHKSTAYSQRLALESRLVFDGAMAATVADVQPDNIDKPIIDNTSASAAPAIEPPVDFLPEKAAPVVDFQPSTDSTTDSPAFFIEPNPLESMNLAMTPVMDVKGDTASTVIVIDPRADNAAALLANPPANTQILTLDPTRDGFQQVADYLQTRHDVTNLHLLTWTDSNTQWLGNKALTGTIESSVSNELALWGDGIAPKANIVFHGADKLSTGWLDYIDALTGATTRWSQDTDVTNALPPRTEIVFIESNITDYQMLMTDVNQGAEVHLLNASQDSLTQIAQILNGRTNIDAIHLFSHGSSASLSLGSDALNSGNLGSYTDVLKQIGSSLSATGDILLYGCDVAQGNAGLQFISQLGILTGADIAASTDLTGAATQGGDWVLEANIGAIEASTLQAVDYAGVLVNLTPTAGGTDNLTGTAVPDNLIISSATIAGYVASGDVFNGGGGNDAIQLSATTALTVDFTGVTLQNWTMLTFSNTGGSTDTVTFTGSQFGTGLVSNALAVNGTGGIQAIVINNSANFTAAGWTFPTWTSGTDTITINGTTSNDTITGSSQKDTITGGTGADILTGGAGADNFTFAAGNSVLTIGGSGTAGTLSGYDVITDYASGSDTLNFTAASLVANGTNINGADSTLQLHTGVVVGTHTIANGIITFNTATPLTSSADVAAAVQYLQAQNWTANGSTVAFNATFGGINHTFVFVQGSANGATDSQDVVIDLQNRTVTAIAGTNILTLTTGIGTVLAPAAPILSPASDSGTLLDNITNDNTPTITGAIGSAAAGAIITFTDSVAGSSLTGATTTVLADGSWSYTPTTALTDTVHSLTVQQTVGGTLSTASTALSLTIDTAAPITSTNTGLTTVLEDAAITTITSAMLSVTDAEPAALLTYTIGTVPTKGVLSKSGVALGVGGTFTQADINSGLLKYTPNFNANGSDSVGFSVSDGAGGTLSGQTFNFTITPVADVNITAGITPVEGATGTFTITLDSAPTADLVINYTLDSASTATLTTDYTVSAGAGISAVTAGTFTILAGQTTATLNVNALTDVVVDPNETVILKLAAGSGYQLSSSSSSSSFATKVDYAIGTTPYSVSTGDFNGDGKLDLAVTNVNSNTVSVLLGTGTGTFAAKVDYATGTTPYSVSTGDFNGDGKLDLAVANANSNTVSVLLGTGTGTFAAKVDYATGTTPYSVSTGDFNGDGKLDLAVTNVNSNTVSVLLGTGTGTFAAKVDYATGTTPYSVSTGDFNGDGKLDLAVTNVNSNTVSVLLGTGTGTFAAKVDYATGTTPYSVSTGDFNGDGKLDLAVANANSNTVSVLLGTGTGTFAAKVDYGTGTNPVSVGTGDFNSDGKLDLAVANFSSNTVSVLLGTGTGTFAAKVDYATGTTPYSVSTGDFNGDGKLDLAVANANSSNVSVLLNNAPPSATLTITDVSNTAPTLGGTFTIAGAVNDNATTTPFSNVTVNDAENNNVSITITYTAANGTLTGAGLTGTAGNYTLTSASLATVQSNLRALVFTPTANQVIPASTVQTIFTLTPNDGTVNGTANATTKVTATSINDAPTGLGNLTLAAVNEDTVSPAGAAINTLGVVFADADVSSSLSGVAIVANTANAGTQGAWQYSTNGGTNWFDIGTVADNNTALALSATTLVRFVPVANYNGAPTGLTVRALDNTYNSFSTTAGLEVRVSINTTTRGGSTAISNSSNTLNTSITAVNDAPALTGTVFVENFDTLGLTGNSNAQYLTGLTTHYNSLLAGWQAAGNSTFHGVEVQTGNWAFMIYADNVGTQIATIAANASGTTYTVNFDVAPSVHFIAGQASDANDKVDIKVYDASNNLLADYQAGGGVMTATPLFIHQSFTYTGDGNGNIHFVIGSAFSGNNHFAGTIDNLSISSQSLTAINEDVLDAANVGNTVASIIVNGSIIDVDYSPATSAPESIAVSAVNNTNGVWQYQIGAGAWTAIDFVANSGKALLLDSADSIRFVPNANWNGTVSNGITFYAWDKTSGSAGTYLTISGNTGGQATLSTATDTASIVVNAVNDAPTGLGNLTLAAVNEDTASPAGAAINSLTGLSFADVDAGATLSGVAIVANTANAGSEGAWQYSTNGGTNWYAIGTVADNNTALALSATTLVRFVPVANYNGTPTGLTVRALDNSYSSFSTTAGSETRVSINTTTTGGITAISASTNTINTSITAVNDAPTASFSHLAYETVTPQRDAGGNIVYSVNNVAALASTVFNRVHYYMQTSVAGTLYYADVSFDAWAGLTIADLQVPAQGAQFTIQRDVTNMTVSSNYAGVVNGSGFTGRLEIWPNNYIPTTTGDIGGSSGTYDFNDTPSAPIMGYGSFQVHNLSLATPQTVFAWNRQQSVGFAPDIGFGNQATANPDWTFAGQNGTSLGATNWKLQISVDNNVGNNYAATEQTALTIKNTGLSIADVDAGASNVTATLSVGEGSLTVTAGGSGALVSGSGTSTVTITGTVAQINNLLNLDATSTVSYIDNTNTPSASTVLTLSVNDGGNTGSGGVLTGSSTATINITAVNDAPVLDNTQSPTLTAINEDVLSVSNTGSTVASIVVNGSITDVDVMTAPEAIAVSAIDNTNGVWQYQIGAGAWTAIDFVANSGKALLLDSADSIRFVPNANWNGTVSNGITFYAWDKTSGSAGTYLTVSGNTGGQATLSTATDTASIVVNAVNDAPTGLGNLTLAAVNEDTASPAGAAINTLGVVFADVDVSSSLSGVAIVANTANAGSEGAWQYSTNGGTNWYAIGTVADNNTALALSATTLVRFVPVANYNGTPTGLTVRALDNSYSSFSTTAGSETRVSINTTTTGGITAIANSTNTINTSITAVNDAPALTGTVFVENFDTLGLSGNANGGQYLTNLPVRYAATLAGWNTGGTNSFHAVQTSAGNFALMIYADNVATQTSTIAANTLGQTYNVSFDIAPSVYQAAGQSSTAADKIDISLLNSANAVIGTYQVGGGAMANPAIFTAQHFTYIGDGTGNLHFVIKSALPADGHFAGTIDNLSISSQSLTAVNEDVLDAANVGNTVASIIVNGSIIDVDYSPATSAPESIAVGAVDNTNGVWQYKIGAGAWTAIDFVANSGKALLLDSADSIRFVPNANWNGTVSGGITFYAWDKTSGSAGTYLTVSGNTGGQATLSTATDTASIVVNAVNDAPVASGSATLTAVLEDISTAATGATVSSLFAGNLSDVTDTITGGSTANTFAGIAISNYTVDAAKGAWQYQTNGAGAWTVLPSATTTTAITLASTDSLRFVPAADYNGAATVLSANLIESGVAITSGGTVNLILTGTGGVTHYSLGTVVLNHTVTAANDAPTGVGNLTLAAVNENTASPAGTAINTLTGFSFTDIDTGATLKGVAVVGSGDGNWQYSTNGGTNWYSIGTVSIANTLVLAPTTLVRYLPLPNYTGTPPALQVKALDNTYAGGFSTTAGAETRVTLVATVNGGTTAIAANTNTISTSVTDVNPIISNATVTLNENSVAGTVVTTVTATNDTNGLIYSITGGNSDVDGDGNLAFSINTSTGVITVNDAGDLNFESVPSFSLAVAVDDEDPDTIADSTATIIVNLQNLDEVAPTITSSATATAINENSGAAQVIYTATSTDTGDIATGATAYSLSGTDATRFSINSITGAVTLTANPNFEAQSNYSFNVVATDAAGNASSKAVMLGINNLDEVAPTITSSATATAINENSGAAQVIYTVTSTDTGDIATGATAYSLSGTDATLFSINSITGAVTLTANPNFEAQSNYSFNVVATDAAGNASSKAVTLAINDLNEAPSVTSSGTLSVAENSTGTVYTATGTDPDTAQTLSWSISGIDAALFSINSSSGALTFNTLPNFELPADNSADNVYDLTVIATDNGTGNLTASKALTITVTNVNEAPTTSAPVSINVTEDVATALTGISFADVDAGSSSVTATLAVNSGTLSATSGSGVTVTGSGSASMTLAGTLANINAFIANSAVSFTTVSNSISDVILSSSLNDNGNSGSGGALSSAVSTTTLMVTPIADTPSVASLTINEDIDSGAIVITRNAVDGAEVTHYKITSITGGTLYSDAGFTSVISAGSFIVSSGATTNVYFRPIADSNTAGAFTVQASTSNTDAGLGGATATSTINITPIADTASVTSTSTIPAIQTTSGLVISRNAVDGAEVTYFKITNIANGTLYQNDGVTQITANSFITFAQANAGLKFTPSGVSNGSFDVQASTSNVDAGLGGSISTATISLGIAIANANTNEDTSTGAIAISGNTGFYKITGITGGTLYSDAGFTTAIINGSFIATSGATTNVYFRPTADFNGTASFVAQGSSSNSDAGLTGNTATSTITVNPVNDAPTGLGNLTLLAVDEDTVSPAGAAINSLGVVFTDVDAGASLAGVAVIANTANANTQGVWQYSTNGINWYNIGTVTGNSALALTVTTSVRFVPALNFNGTPPSLTVRALDNTYAEGFTNGATLVLTNSTINGGSSAIAANTNTIGTNNIVAVNDAPVFSGLANTVNFTEDSAAVALGSAITLSDVDLNSLNYANATLTLVRNGSANAEDVFANTGTLSALTQGGNLTVNGVVIGTVTTNSAGLLSLTFNSNATKALVNSALQQITYSNLSNTPPTSVQINWLFNDNNTGAQGKGGALSALRSTTVAITPTNDAPIALNDSATVVNGGTLNGSSLLANDTDPENDVLTVNTTPITNVAHGALTLYANGSYLYQHDGSAAKTDSFVYEITDGHGGKAQATVTMTISGSPLVQPSSGNAVFLNNLSVFFDNFLTSGSLILLSNPSHYNESDSRYIFEDKKQLLDYQYHGDYGLPPVHLSLYIPLRYHHIISVAGFLPNQTLIAQEFYAFKIPKWLFQHRNSYETLKFTATHLDGKALPDWIKLNPKTLTFFGLAPKGAQDMSVMMTIGDQYGNKVHSVFTIHVTDKVPAKNMVGEQRRVAGKSGFSEQLYSAGKVSKLQESRRLLDSLNHL